jgi:hypothetical protein
MFLGCCDGKCRLIIKQRGERERERERIVLLHPHLLHGPGYVGMKREALGQQVSDGGSEAFLMFVAGEERAAVIKVTMEAVC